MNKVRHCVSEESGATSVEYAIMAGLIAVVIVVAVRAIGTSLVPIFQNVAAGIASS